MGVFKVSDCERVGAVDGETRLGVCLGSIVSYSVLLVLSSAFSSSPILFRVRAQCSAVTSRSVNRSPSHGKTKRFAMISKGSLARVILVTENDVGDVF